MRLHELADRLHVEQSALEAILRYHDDLPEYQVATPSTIFPRHPLRLHRRRTDC